jgi:hypothetical protein
MPAPVGRKGARGDRVELSRWRGKEGGSVIRKLGVAGIAVACIAIAPAHAQTVGGGGEQVFAASANWVLSRSSHAGRFRFVDAYKSIDPVGATNTIADYGNVRCGIGEDGRVIVTSCSVKTRIVFLKPDRFVVDPLLREARLTLTENGVTHIATWTVNEGRPTPSYALHGDGRSIVLGASIRSGADAHGRVMGDRFATQKDSGIASLRRGVEAQAVWETDGGGLPHNYQHRSRSLRAAWKWIRSLVESRRR